MALAKQTTRIGSSTPAVGRRGPLNSQPLVSLVLGALSALGMMISMWLIFVYTPMDALQGEPQRIFYLHVPTAWIGMFAYVVMTVAGIIYLFKADERIDWIARASAEVGLVFLTITLILGMLWGKPIWGAWWVWDPKLTAALILWFMYVGYIMLRSYWGRNRESARGGAVVGIIGIIDVPIIYMSVLWWRGQHPAPISDLPPQATLTLLVTLASVTLLYCFLMIQAYQLQRLQTLAQRLRAIVE
ncbi:MAG: cytochrome c biogenesis protein CcsA [Ktedonobacteraceae bacterium]